MMHRRKEMSFSRTNFSNHINQQREKAGYIIIVPHNKKEPHLFEKSPIRQIESEFQGNLLREQNIHRACQLCESCKLSPTDHFLKVIVST